MKMGAKFIVSPEANMLWLMFWTVCVLFWERLVVREVKHALFGLWIILLLIALALNATLFKVVIPMKQEGWSLFW